MRSRNLKPGIFKNEYLAKMDPNAFILFTGLWCLADREGRLEDRPDRIEAEIFPFKFQKVKVEHLLTLLDAAPEPFIKRYSKDEKRYIQIINFTKHQYPHHREQDSQIPAWEGTSPGLAQGKPESSPSESLLSSVSSNLNPSIPRDGFDLIWNQYPRREGRKAAVKFFRASVKTSEDWSAIQRALQNYLEKLRRDKTEPQFIKMGSTWFNNWQDWTKYNGAESVKTERPIYHPKEPDKPMTEQEQKEGLEFTRKLKEALRGAVKEIPK